MTAQETEIDSRLAVDVGGGLRLKNPVMPASGCFGPEMGSLFDLGLLGALVPKTIFYAERAGNPAPRTAETPAGMLNSIGIPSRGVEHFLTDLLPQYTAHDAPVIVSIGGLRMDDYDRLAERLNGETGVAGLEVNISCPNLEAGGMEIGANPANVERVVRGVSDRFGGPVIAKLTPNVTSITEIALAAEQGGATAISAINTLSGMVIDVDNRRTVTGTMTGGVSGPGIRPIAVRMVWQVANAVGIPVIGVGGITSARDALEFILAGATAVGIGTANFTRPVTMLDIIEGLTTYIETHSIANIADIRGHLEEGMRVAIETPPTATPLAHARAAAE